MAVEEDDAYLNDNDPKTALPGDRTRAQFAAAMEAWGRTLQDAGEVILRWDRVPTYHRQVFYQWVQDNPHIARLWQYGVDFGSADTMERQRETGEHVRAGREDVEGRDNRSTWDTPEEFLTHLMAADMIDEAKTKGPAMGTADHPHRKPMKVPPWVDSDPSSETYGYIKPGYLPEGQTYNSVPGTEGFPAPLDGQPARPGKTGNSVPAALTRTQSLGLAAAVWARLHPQRAMPPLRRDDTRNGGWFDETYGWTDEYGYTGPGGPSYEQFDANRQRKQGAMDRYLEDSDWRDSQRQFDKVDSLGTQAQERQQEQQYVDNAGAVRQAERQDQHSQQVQQQAATAQRNRNFQA
jgi:hypothetical protein